MTPALAQVPNAQATVDATASFYLNQGVLGATCVLLLLLLAVAGVVIRHLYNDLKAVNAKTGDDRERLIKAIEGQTDTSDGLEKAMEAIKAVLESRGQAVSDLSHQMERTAQDARHSFANLGQAAAGIVTMLAEIRTIISGRSGGGAP